MRTRKEWNYFDEKYEQLSYAFTQARDSGKEILAYWVTFWL